MLNAVYKLITQDSNSWASQECDICAHSSDRPTLVRPMIADHVELTVLRKVVLLEELISW